MRRSYMCSSHTVSGVMPGGAVAARHLLATRLEAVARAGYEGLWFHFRDYREQRAAGVSDAALRALFDAHGMKHRGVEFLTDWFLHGRETEAERDAFAAAEAIGARVVNVGGDFAGRGIAPGLMIGRFEALCARAAARRLSVALEFVPFSNVADIRTALAFLRPPNAGVVLDCWHLFRGGMPLADIGLLPADRVHCVQVSDAAAAPSGGLARDTMARLPCGQGAFDLHGFAAALDRHGIDVPLSVEIISLAQAAASAAEAAQRSIDAARSVFDRA